MVAITVLLPYFKLPRMYPGLNLSWPACLYLLPEESYLKRPKFLVKEF